MACTMLLVLALHASAASAALRHLRDLEPPRPTPMHSSFHAPTIVNDVHAANTQVHVMERCCPYSTHYAVGAYPSALEADGWAPALSFHAFEYDSSLDQCWQIVDTTARQDNSHVWGPIKQFAQEQVAPVDANRSFCLPSAGQPIDERFTIHYVESADRQASFITQPVEHCTSTITDRLSLCGWPAPSPSTIATPIYPLAFYFWRELSPRRLITDLHVHEVLRNASTFSCADGYEALPGDLSMNKTRAYSTRVCAKIDDYAELNPVLNLTSANHTYLTSVHFVAQGSVKFFESNGSMASTVCSDDLELVDDDLGSGSFDVEPFTGDPSSGSQDLDSYYNLTSAMKPVDPVTLCVLKQSLLRDDGSTLPTQTFVSTVVINETTTEWRHMVHVVLNSDSNTISKRSPVNLTEKKRAVDQPQ